MEQVRAVVDLAESLAYLSQAAEPELVELMHALVDGVKVPVQSKMALFGSVGKAKQ
jgi:hypothetical protein